MKKQALMKTGRPASRRGVTLLFVLSLIVLFLLMGASFLLIASQFKRSAMVAGRLKVRRDDARSLVNRAFYDVFRGVRLDDARSPLRGHSILEDMYGYGAVTVVAEAANATNTGNQLLNIRFDSEMGVPEDQFQNMLSNSPENFSDQSGVYNGLIVTFVSGPATGVSCRVISYQVGGGGPHPSGFQRGFTLAPVWDNRNSGALDLTPALLVGSRVVINGRPFAGSGAGTFNPQAGSDQAALGANALLPNRLGDSRGDLIVPTGYLGRVASAVGNSQSVNEDYDAPDFQNMFLAGGLDRVGNPIVSFARRTLEEATTSNPRSVFRAFNRGTPGAAPEVDNNGDGQPDSHWMDINLPLQTDMKGRVYKPLVAYHIVDMDGRLNLNAQGNLAQLPANNYFKTNLPLLENVFGSGTFGTSLSFGQGYGPPEINLLGALSPGEATAVMLGGGGQLGRYGLDGVPGGPNRDLASGYKLFGLPQAAFGVPGLVGFNYGSPLDIHGRFGYGTANLWRTNVNVDPYGLTGAPTNIPVGLPVADIAASSLIDEVTNSAYEFDFTSAPFSTSAVDSPFTATELEGFLRAGDSDSQSLPPRLRNILSAGLRDVVTTDSYEVPVPPTHLVDKLYEILTTVGGLPISTLAERQFVDQQIYLMLAPEIRRGQRMDINRPFGNGADDGVTNAAQGREAGVVDEPGEPLAGEVYLDPYGRTIAFDANNDGIQGGVDELLARQIFARHLYVLTLLTTQWVDRNGDGAVNLNDWYDYDGNGTLEQADLILFRHHVAQWAVNVVDFRDRDSIMTPFEYDLNPWDGWNVDGNIGPGSPDNTQPFRGLVWGSEQPDLLITESFAQHLRMTEDLDNDSSGNPNHNLGNGDATTDNRYVPNTSAFIELFACRRKSGTPLVENNNQILPPELYGPNGLDLQRRSLDGSSPVWRLSVRARYLGDATPDDNGDDTDAGGAPDPALANASELRRVYFIQPAASVDTGNKVYFPPGLTLPQLPIGEYAVVGGGLRDGARYDTYLGFRNTASWLAELNNTRRVSLIPDNNFANNLVQLRFWDGGNWQTQNRNAVAIPVNQPDLTYEGGFRPFGITDPVAGYGVLAAANPNLELRLLRDGATITSAGFEFWDTSLNQPFVFDNPVDRPDPFVSPTPWDNLYINGIPMFAGFNPFTPPLALGGLRDDGLLRNHSAVFLQRLANPLLPFDPVTNPYRTVDALGVDVNVFNGVSSVAEPDAIGGLPNLMASVERGTNEQVMNRQRLLWKSNSDGRYVADSATRPELATQTVGDSHRRSFNLFNSLGGIDVVYRYNQLATFPNPVINAVAFPWMTWNDRPYVSQQELTLVPFADSFNMLGNFDTHETARPLYDGGPSGNPFNQALPLAAGQFGHLWSFFNDSYSQNANPVLGAPSLHRVLDYLEVPSRFTGTETFLNPAVFAVGNPSPAVTYLGLNPPRNSLSHFRYPGKINLNTLFDQRVYTALMGANYSGAVNYGVFDQSRRLVASGIPTDFPYVFRAAEFANYVPPGVPLQRSSTPTLFRDQNPGVVTGTALFDFATSATPHNDPNRSAYFRYDMRQRLGNLVTTRSSVFAIWITVGFFEVDPVTGDVLDIEVGSETGETQRYRGFFLVDRSIPVACEPGENHNVDQAILASSILDDDQ